MRQEAMIKLFDERQVRVVWDDEKQKYYFSIVDVVQVLTDSDNPTDYLKKMRKRDPELGSYIGTNCPQVPMETSTGKKRLTLAVAWPTGRYRTEGFRLYPPDRGSRGQRAAEKESLIKTNQHN